MSAQQRKTNRPTVPQDLNPKVSMDEGLLDGFSLHSLEVKAWWINKKKSKHESRGEGSTGFDLYQQTVPTPMTLGLEHE